MTKRATKKNETERAKKTVLVKKTSVTAKTTKAKKLTKEKLEEIKQTAPENIGRADFAKLQEEELKKLNKKYESDNQTIKLMEQVQKLEQKNEILQVKYRTKYMEAEHVRKQWRDSKNKLLDIITELKTELIKYAPNDCIIEMASKISEITSENNTGRKRAL